MSLSISNIIDLKNDQDFPAIQKKKSRNLKPRDKWNLLWFMPSQVLNSREDVTDGKGRVVRKGKRFGFDRFNQLGCKVCRRTFHKYQSLAFHNKDQHNTLSNRPSISRSPSVPVKKNFSEPVRKSRRVSLKPVSYDDDIEILEIDASPKKSKDIDDNFGKLSLSAKRKIVEEYNNEPKKEESTKSIKIKKKKLNLMGKTHDDEIEVIDLEDDDEPKAIKVNIEITPVSLNINKNDKFSVDDENIDAKECNKKRKQSSCLPILEQQSDKKLKGGKNENTNDLVEVKSSSGKSMLVKKATLESILASKSLQATVASKDIAGKVGETTELKNSPVARRISRRMGA